MRESAAATIIHYLEKAQERLELSDVDETDLEKVLENLENAEKELNKELEEER